MISPHRIQFPGCGDEAVLARMLEDRLSLEEQFELTEHLDGCDACQQKLEGLTANDGWWEDTKSVLQSLEAETKHESELKSLSGVTSARKKAANPLCRPPGDNLSEEYSDDPANPSTDHWVIGLLETSDEPNSIGAIDSMAVEGIVGQGGMGVVLRVRDPELPRQLAVKLLSPMLANSGAARQRFLREAQSAASIVHPNIVPIYSVNAQRKLPYLVMPFVGGGNLQQILDREGPLPLDRVLAIGNQVAEALAEAHAQGIVHRDIKPANLLLDEGGFRVLLTDFGLARALDDATLTASGMIAGTPQFMSPEQAAGKSVDSRSDIYSLGAVLYALATGRPPAHGDSTLDVLRKIHEEDPEPAFKINERLPKWFQTLLDQLMQKDLESRIPRADQAAELIRGALAHVRSPHQVALPLRLRHTPRRWTRRIASSTAAIACCIAFYLLSISWWEKWSQSGGLDSSTSTMNQWEATSSTPSDQPTLDTPAVIDAPAKEQMESLQFTSEAPGKLRSDTEWYAPYVAEELRSIEGELQRLQLELGVPKTEPKTEGTAKPVPR